MKNDVISAGIILFKPKRDRLMLNIKNIYDQVEHIYLYNNSSSEQLLIELQNFSKVVILGKGVNVGIASAMNRIMETAEKNGEQWVITYDQDSISESNLIVEYKKMLNISNIAIVCPQIIDERRKYIVAEKKNLVESVSRCITSASCTRIEAWKSIGGFDEFLFIDLVDNDFCKRLKINGWEILKLYNVILNQEFGNIELKKPKTVDIIMKISNFFKNKLHMNNFADNIGKLSYKKQVSPMRVYYTNRNVIYLNKKYCNYGGIGYECYKCKSYIGFQVCFNLASFFRGEKKAEIIKAIFWGIKDGITSSVLPIP